MAGRFVITGFADEISGNLTEQIEGLKKLDMHYMEMRGADGNNLIFHTDEKVKEIKERLDDAGIALSALAGTDGIADVAAVSLQEFVQAVADLQHPHHLLIRLADINQLGGRHLARRKRLCLGIKKALIQPLFCTFRLF